MIWVIFKKTFLKTIIYSEYIFGKNNDKAASIILEIAKLYTDKLKDYNKVLELLFQAKVMCK